MCVKIVRAGDPLLLRVLKCGLRCAASSQVFEKGSGQLSPSSIICPPEGSQYAPTASVLKGACQTHDTFAFARLASTQNRERTAQTQAINLMRVENSILLRTAVLLKKEMRIHLFFIIMKNRS